MNMLYGNYIGKDIGVVILKKYSFVYIFDKLKNNLESYLLHTNGFICKAAYTLTAVMEKHTSRFGQNNDEYEYNL